MAPPLPSRQADAFSVEVPPDNLAVENARLALIDWLEPHDLGARVINRVEVILEEIVSNVVRHGKSADFVRVSAALASDSLGLVIEDNGPPFNPLDREAPDEFSTLEEATLGGQGIPLVRRLSRSVSYERAGASNRVTSIIALN